MEKARLLTLMEKYRSSNCTEAELKELFDFYESVDIYKAALLEKDDPENQDFVEENYRQFLLMTGKGRRRNMQRSTWIKIAAAAILVLAVSFSWKLFFHKDKIGGAYVANIKNDAEPGHSGAILTLADGSTIILDSAGNGTIAKQGSTSVVNDSGELAYQAAKAPEARITYNTLNTPKARQYKLVLPDGTKVWLNAASTIKFPTAFTGNERTVEITGEAYFEVAHNAQKPFRVMAAGLMINDIGTHFDVMAYPDEPAIKTTLLEGAVKVSNGKEDKLLKPGEQAQVSANQGIKVVQLPDAQDAVAWKNGIINFSSADIATLFRQISRWYNVDIVYEGKIPEGHITGDIYRNLKLSEVIEELAYNHIHCRLEGNKLIVSQ